MIVSESLAHFQRYPIQRGAEALPVKLPPQEVAINPIPDDAE